MHFFKSAFDVEYLPVPVSLNKTVDIGASLYKNKFFHFDFITRMQVHDSWEDNLRIVYLKNSSSLWLLVLSLSQLPYLFSTKNFQLNFSQKKSFVVYQISLLVGIIKFVCYLPCVNVTKAR